MTKGPGRSQTFNKASGLIAPRATGGMDHLLNEVISQKDVTIFSDNHLTAQTLWKDFLNPAMLSRFSAAGVTDIHTEMTPQLNGLRDRLLKGEMSVDQFVAAGLRQNRDDNINLSFVKDKTGFMRSLGQGILDARDKGIDVHFSRVPPTPEQNDRRRELVQQEKQITREMDGKIRDKHTDIENFTEQAGLPVLQKIDFYSYLKNPQTLQKAIEPGTLDKIFNGSLSPEQQDVIRADLEMLKDYKQRAADAKAAVENHRTEYRIGGDVKLAQDVYDISQGRGRAIIFHGAAHGAQNKEDLDDHVNKLGLSVARINVSYDESDKQFLTGLQRTGNLTDVSEIFYNPEKDSVETIDIDGNRMINGGPDLSFPTSPEAPKPSKPAAPRRR